jgi:hypothetical protein
VRNEEVLLRVKEQRNILHEINKRKANWTGNILRRNCLLQQVIERKDKGDTEVKGRRGRRRRKLLGDLKERKGLLISNFRRVLNVVRFFLDDSPACVV